ncbi:MAG TPA: TetR family transcriptional regulator, partial [Micromonosporaceae bacterium]|nr:TetR family transcriptional regulator [Micromonosporaceae bacterium]
MSRRSGRRPGNPDTRQAIMTSARHAFAERGYDGASIRAIATDAGVDPALVHHYFGTKEQLFLQALQMPVNPQAFLPRVIEGDQDQIGVRLVTTFLSVWDSPVGTTTVALLRSAMSADWTIPLIREFLTTQVLRPLLARVEIDPAEAPLRASLVASQMAGLAVIRYIYKLEPLASA